MSIKDFDIDVFEYVVRVRRHIHEHPELSFNEHKTAQYIEGLLDELGIKHSRLNGTGIVADITGKSPGNTVALRADTDALPVKEENELPFASKNQGIMHACGHDTHVAMVMGVAKLLSKKDLPQSGNVRLIFQPAEEKAPGGAIGMIKEGALDGVDYALGQHANPNIPAGTVALYRDTMMAFTDDFSVEFRSTGGHSAYPNETTDVIVLAAQFIDVVQSIISRRKDPFDPAVISIGKIHGGSADNIIPPSVKLSGTIRTLKVETRDRIRKELEDLAKGLSSAFNAQYDYEYTEGYPALVNRKEITEILEEISADLVGKENIFHPLPDLGGEDFAYFTEKVPGSYYYLGVGKKENNENNLWHSPTFYVDEESMRYGTEILYRATVRLLEEKGRSD